MRRDRVPRSPVSPGISQAPAGDSPVISQKGNPTAMDKSVEYHGYTIEPAPQLAEEQLWRPGLFISVEDDRGVRTRTF